MIMTPQYLHARLRYEPETGKLFWRDGPRAGKEAGSLHCNGYCTIRVMTKAYFAHRLIWLMEHGEFPPGDIDHINGDKQDNRLENLRAVTRQENLRNKKLEPRNNSGAMGVSFDNGVGKWRAQITINRKSKYLGVFENKQDAINCRKKAEMELGFHENHGRVIPCKN